MEDRLEKVEEVAKMAEKRMPDEKIAEQLDIPKKDVTRLRLGLGIKKTNRGSIVNGPRKVYKSNGIFKLNVSIGSIQDELGMDPKEDYLVRGKVLDSHKLLLLFEKG